MTTVNDEIKNLRSEVQSIKDNIATVPKIAAAMAEERHARQAARWRLAAIILAALLLVSNVLWINYAAQFEKVVETTETATFEDVDAQADDGSGVNIAGGDINNYGSTRED